MRLAFDAGERRSTNLIDVFNREIEATVGVVDYAEVRSIDDLELVEVIENTVIVAVAVNFGQARLLDNLTLSNAE